MRAEYSSNLVRTMPKSSFSNALYRSAIRKVEKWMYRREKWLL